MSRETKILVTGGAGYIGSHICKRLNGEGYTPICLDNLSSGHREFVRWGPLLEVDLCDTASLQQKLAGLEFAAVIHMAAYIEVAESMRQPLRFFHNNVGGALSLLQVLPERTPILFSSTAAVYGDPGLEQIPESTPLAPMNPYGQSKRMVEDMLRSLWTSRQWPSITLRYFNVAGADPEGEIGEWHEPESHLIPLLLAAVQSKEGRVKIFGDDYQTPDGTCLRDYVHVDDLADAHVCALKLLLTRPTYDCFNIGYSQGHSVREVVSAVEKVCGRTLNVQIEARRPGDPSHLVANADRARRELNWTPHFAKDLNQTIAHAWNWQKKLAQRKS